MLEKRRQQDPNWGQEAGRGDGDGSDGEEKKKEECFVVEDGTVEYDKWEKKDVSRKKLGEGEEGKKGDGRIETRE